jgi:hypothetical protein
MKIHPSVDIDSDGNAVALAPPERLRAAYSGFLSDPSVGLGSGM